MSFLLGLPIFRGYVKFPGCIWGESIQADWNLDGSTTQLVLSSLSLVILSGPNSVVWDEILPIRHFQLRLGGCTTRMLTQWNNGKPNQGPDPNGDCPPISTALAKHVFFTAVFLPMKIGSNICGNTILSSSTRALRSSLAHEVMKSQVACHWQSWWEKIVHM